MFYNAPNPAPAPDWSFQLQVTGLLVRITEQLAELADAVHALTEKLAEGEKRGL